MLIYKECYMNNLETLFNAWYLVIYVSYSGKVWQGSLANLLLHSKEKFGQWIGLIIVVNIWQA